MSNKKTIDTVFQRSMQDLIKGIRSHKKDTSEFISLAIAEIKTELKSTDPFLKAEALRKLTYLQMQGYNISWSAFAIIEVMSQPRFAHKRIGFLAANQSFNDQTEVLMLTTNLFKKEFTSHSGTPYDIGVAINSLANIANLDLARDCISDLVTLMDHPRAYVRKKAVLGMYKMYLKFPTGLRLTFDKLSEKLDDPETSVSSTAVNVICELANKNPRNYLSMAPKFFKLLTTSSNNWMLIKIVKLLGSLVPEEPRLARKLLDPLATIIQNTTAKSLQYECINTITAALPHSRREDGTEHKNMHAIIGLCSDYLKGFIEDKDPNLKYLGLVGLVDLMPTSPRTVVTHREIILRCLNDDDVTIRTRALQLLAGIVSKKSLIDLVTHLLEHIKYADGVYRDEIIEKVMHMCVKDKYALLTDFAWYASVLLNLATTQGSRHGPVVAEQLIEITLRVESLRPYAVEAMLTMLFDEKLVLGQARRSVTEVLRAAAWIVGEYSDVVSTIADDHPVEGFDSQGNPDDDEPGYWMEGPRGEEILSRWRGTAVHEAVLKVLLDPRSTNLPAAVQETYVQSAMKIFVRACADCSKPDLACIIGVLRSNLGVFLQSMHVEVQERASTLRHVLDEFEILPLGWEESEKAYKEQVGTLQSAETESPLSLDLMDFPQIAATAHAIDERGAEAAMRKKAVLSALICEPFYAVHAKAQRRVPVPDGLQLDTPFSAEELQKILDFPIPENLQIQKVAFGHTAYTPPIPDRDPNATSFSSSDFPQDSQISHNSHNSNSSHNNKDSNGGPDGSGNGTTGTGTGAPSSSSSSSSSSSYAPPSQDNSMYYLGGSGGGKGPHKQQQLGDILAEGVFEVEETFQKRRKKKEVKEKKEKKGDKKEKQQAAVVFKNSMPGGASDSDEEDLFGDKKKSRQKSSSSNSRFGINGHGSRSPTDALSAIDLSAPLGAEDCLPEFRHRVVEYTEPIPQSAPVGQDRDQQVMFESQELEDSNGGALSVQKGKKEKKEKKGKKDKDKDKEKEKGSAKAKKDKSGTSGAASANLLGLDYTPAPAPIAAPAPVVVPQMKEKEKEKGKEKSKKDKKDKEKEKDKKDKKKSKTKSKEGGLLDF